VFAGHVADCVCVTCRTVLGGYTSCWCSHRTTDFLGKSKHITRRRGVYRIWSTAYRPACIRSGEYVKWL